MKFSALRILAFPLVCAALGTALPVRADPPHWVPAHVHHAHPAREYRYVYYPMQQVYYEPVQRVWFWMNGGGWQVGVALPARYRVYADAGVPVLLHSNRPYVEHVYVEQHYGRPWRASHRAYYERREWHERHEHREHEEHHERHGHGDMHGNDGDRWHGGR